MWVIAKVVAEWDVEEVNDGLGLVRSAGDGEGYGGGMAERRSANSLTLPMEGGLPVRARFRQGLDGIRSGEMEARKARVEDDAE
jgi:hypothetical protein